MDYTEKPLRELSRCSGIVVDVTLDQVQLADGSTSLRQVVHHPGGAAVLPVDGDGCAWCVRQFRYPYGRPLLEIPAGKLEPGEDPALCARRELSEETGFTAARWVDLGCLYTSPGYSTETLWLYLALELEKGDAHLDEGEFLDVERIPLKTLLQQVMQGQLCDAKTVAAVLKASHFLRLA